MKLVLIRGRFFTQGLNCVSPGQVEIYTRQLISPRLANAKTIGLISGTGLAKSPGL